MEDTLKAMLVDSQYIVDMDPGKRYTPKTYDYKVACSKFNTVIAKHNDSAAILDNLSTAGLNQPNGGCSIVGFDVSWDNIAWAPVNATNQKISTGLYKMVVAGPFVDGQIMDSSPLVYIFDSGLCLSGIDSRSYQGIPRSGMTFPPSTLLFRCRYPSGAMQLAASTTFPFSVRHVEDFATVISAIFDRTADLPLLNIMDTHTRNGTFASLTSNSTIVTLTDTNGAQIHYLSCNSRWVTVPTDLSLLCRYIVVDALRTTAQPGDPAIAAALGSRNASSISSVRDDITLAISHFASSSTSTGMAVYSVSSILNATSAASSYLASLGPNVVMDAKAQKLTILYDTVEIQSVIEIPTVLFWVMVAVMTVCVGLMVYSIIKIDTIHSGTLYMILYEKLAEKNEPALMNCNFEPLAFDGTQIITGGSNGLKKSEA
ncbi:hypothetical protein BG006_002086 [Podila minutissima]|uniref:Uncharacterized protein n=1 Tax=Podila minutissima TaxID=64525 RepID=A0A9P5SR39_9FUNG|nr:hypothetical protein BG006_002086 [Podila minutissima]